VAELSVFCDALQVEDKALQRKRMKQKNSLLNKVSGLFSLRLLRRFCDLTNRRVDNPTGLLLFQRL
jgi:hypothetical protein